MPLMISKSVIDDSAAETNIEPDGEIHRLALTKLSMGLELLEPEHASLPKKLTIVPKLTWKRLPDVFGNSGGPYFLSARLHDLIERLEPNAQRYVPVTLETSVPFNDVTKHDDYFLLLPPPEIDCIDISQTAFSAKYPPKLDANGALIEGGVLTQNVDDPCAMRNCDILGHHLWRLPKGWDHHLFCSDALWREFMDQGMKGWMTLKKCIVV